MKLVIDASAAVASFGETTAAGEILDQTGAADLVMAPELIAAEIVNAVWKYFRFAGLHQSTCEQQITFGLSLVDTFVPCIDLYREAFALAREARRSAYDMFYLALARREGAILLTLDSSLKKEAERRGIEVI